MSANAAAKKQKPLKRHPSKLKKMSAYAILAIILISILAVLFAFPLYWIITGSFKTGAAINSTTRHHTGVVALMAAPVLKEPVMIQYSGKANRTATMLMRISVRIM